MKRRLALYLPFLLLAACTKPGSSNSIWIAFNNDSGKELRNVSLDYGSGVFRYELVGHGYTYGDWAKMPESARLSITFTEGAKEQRLEARTALTPSMIGGALVTTLNSDLQISENFEPRSARAPRQPDWTNWMILGATFLLALLAGAVLLFAGPPALRGLRKGITAARSNPALEELKTRLRLVRKPCPVPMFTLDSKKPAQWWESAIGGRMIGVVDHGFLWVGAPDEEALFGYSRKAEGGGFVEKSFLDGEFPPLARDSEFLQQLAALSPAISSVRVMGEAIEARFDWKTAQAGSLANDVKILSALLTLVEQEEPSLLVAIRQGDDSKALSMIREGADLESRGMGYLNPLVTAAMKGRTEIVKALIAAGANTQPEFGFPLHVAARAGHLEIVRALIEAGIPVDSRDAPNDTALIEAAKDGRAPIVEYLLSKGANPALSNSDGGTALGYARHGRFKAVIDMLNR